MARQEPPSRDMSLAVQIGDVVVSWTAENCSWEPSVARDLQDRVISTLHDVLVEGQAAGVLISPDTVYFDDGSAELEGEEEEQNG